MTDGGEKGAGAVRLTPLPGELLHLDLLRFVASVGIVLAHSLEFVVPPPLRPWWRTRLAALPLFVDTFFVVSGYIIARLYTGRITTWRDHAGFLQRRVARLLPLHLATIACWLALFAAIGLVGAPLHHDVSLAPACLATATLLLTAVVDCGGLPVAEVNWSISAEMAMYLLFPLLLLVTGRRAWRAAALACVAFGLVVAIHHGAMPWQTYLDVGRAFPAFIFGIALFLAEPVVARIPAARAGLAVMAALPFVSIVLDVPNPILIAAAYGLPVFAVAADRHEPGSFICRVAPLGQLTYSIYLLHGLVIAVLLNAIADKLLHWHGPAMAGAVALSWGVVLLLSRWSLAYLETPARDALNRLQFLREGPRRPPTALGVRG